MNAKLAASGTLPNNRKGRYLPQRVRVRFANTPIAGSISPSHVRHRKMMSPATLLLSPSTSV